MNTTTTHSPLPWAIKDKLFIVIPQGREPWIASVADFNGLTHQENWANAEFIVRACNVHDELLAACKAAFEELAKDSCECSEDHPNLKHCPVCACRAAIAKAEGKI